MSVSEWMREWGCGPKYIGCVIILTCVNSCKKDLLNKSLIEEEKKTKQSKVLNSQAEMREPKYRQACWNVKKGEKKTEINSEKQKEQIRSVYNEQQTN